MRFTTWARLSGSRGLRISVLPDTAAGGCEDALWDLLRPEIQAAVWAKFKDKDGHAKA